MKKIILAIFCVFALLFGLIGNVFAGPSCVWSTEPNGCEYGICVESGAKWCVECCHGHGSGSICTMVKNPCTDEPTKVESRGERAYQANCGIVDPNRITPFPPDQDFCPGNNLVCMTNFCGGGTGCPYVCCPKGLPYLNHCDCKCYATADFDCHSYSYCKEQSRQLK
jgi:hypothetical protein